jgi:hypothetical protein
MYIRSGGNAFFDLMRFAQHVAAAPDGLDEVAAFAGIGELLAKFADEDVDDFRLGWVETSAFKPAYASAFSEPHRGNAP